jgi:hypothetical protein
VPVYPPHVHKTTYGPLIDTALYVMQVGGGNLDFFGHKMTPADRPPCLSGGGLHQCYLKS